jgi:F-type H+-transporting ATPase subunit beta
MLLNNHTEKYVSTLATSLSGPYTNQGSITAFIACYMPPRAMPFAIDPEACCISPRVQSCLSARHRLAISGVKTTLAEHAQWQHLPDRALEASQLRGRKVIAFLTQPFVTMEAPTGLPGKIVRLTDTLDGVEQIIQGQVDDLPVEAFYMVGTMEEVKAKADRMMRSGA